MNGGASSSNPPPRPPQAAAAPTLLAPGFRFHPTDEELVIYYLKRKVSGRPLRVDAIAEVDLYKTEPWDLPSLSRLRTGDMEWYFFSSLECKYANRSRTNRTTAQGYWKTTGKDRPVRHGQRTVGMKKTLVFHAGRAPRGERTNWVMHEYRLEDEELARAGVPQDAYVLCRIFQKSGTGPQNGAQYGAPFVEEEWEGIENLGMADIVDGQDSGDTDNLGNADAVVVAAGDEGFLQLADFENKQNQHNQHESTDPLAASSTDEQNISNHSEDPIFLVEGIFQGHIPGDDMQAPGLQDYQTSYYDMGQNVSLAGQSHCPPIGSDGYLQLNDFGDMVKVGFHSSEDSVGSLFDASNDQIAVNQLDESSNVPKSHGTDVFFDNVNGNIKSNDMLQIPPAQDPFFLELNDLLNLDYPLEDNVGFYDASNNDQLLEDNVGFYDAINNDQLFEEDNFVQMQDLYPPLANTCELNSMEDVMAYFDPIENSTQGSLETCIGSSSTKRSTMEADVSSVPPYNTNPESSVMNVGASSQLVTPHADNQLNSVCEKVTAAPDSQKKDGRGRTFSKHIANLLGSFSAPPAYAAESVASPSKSSVRSAAASSASSIHVSAGTIEIDGSNMKGMADHWSLHKNENNGFLFSFGVARNVFVNSECSESMINMQGWAMSVALRGGFYIFLLLALLLALCFRVGTGVCSR